jgi:hypothetical protein
MNTTTRPRIKLRSPDGDSLFSDAQTAARAQPEPTRATCRVCELSFIVAPDQPAIICPHCTVDLDATEAHVTATRDGAIATYTTAKAQLEALVDAADAKVRARYDVVREKLYECLGLPDTALQRRLDATIAEGDALSAIVEADLELHRITGWRFERETWARRALGEIGVWREGGLEV